MKILSAEQIRKADSHTIKFEPIESIDLMERAAGKFVEWFRERVHDTDQVIHVFCGMGNNGGDGLVAARMLYRQFYEIQVYIVKFSDNFSSDAGFNFERLPEKLAKNARVIRQKDDFPELDPGSIVIDAIFGSGLTRPVEGIWAELFSRLNQGDHEIYSIDIPSGLYCDRRQDGIAIKASETFSFEVPKLSFFVPDSAVFAGVIEVGSIGLDKEFIGLLDTDYYFTRADEIRKILRPRDPFSHKGTFGHVLMACGSLGSMGAALLAGRAALKSGCGLLTMHVPACGYQIVQTALPEAMVSIDLNQFYLSELPDTGRFDAIGVGSGMGTKHKALHFISSVLDVNLPTVIDADAINVLAKHKDWLEKLPDKSILTPHPGEFDRLCGKCKDGWERLESARRMAEMWNTVIVLKGHYTAVVNGDGSVYFNPTGNSGMATAGSGDVLTGILTSLLGQGYDPFDAARIGVYLHGRAGDIASVEGGEEGLIAGDIIEHLGRAFQSVRYGT
jgi:NAD(P)H-hydrate epimerase